MLVFYTLLQQNTFLQHSSHLQLINSINQKQCDSNFQSKIWDPNKNIPSCFRFGAARTLQ